MQDTHPFIELRRKIRQTGTHFKKNDYDKNSVFHQDGELCYAYDIAEVEEALDQYASTLSEDYQEMFGTVTLKSQVSTMAERISVSHVSMEARDFARTVRAYLAVEQSDKENKSSINVLSLESAVRNEKPK